MKAHEFILRREYKNFNKYYKYNTIWKKPLKIIGMNQLKNKPKTNPQFNFKLVFCFIFIKM